MNYLDGIGVNKDYRKAVEWFEKAVENGYAPSANNLGNLYNSGMGVEKSILKSFNYYKLAAEGGLTAAMCNLANCYFKDVGYGPRFPSTEDKAEGLKWLKLAANKGNPNAVEELNIIQENVKNKKEMDFEGIILKSDAVSQAHPLDFEQFGKLVYEAALKGSSTAKKHMEIFENLIIALESFKKNNSEEFVKAMSKAIRLNPDIVGIPEIYMSLVEERIKNFPNELDSIICYVQMNRECEKMKEYLQNVVKQFPEDEYLAEKLSFDFLNNGELEAALNQIEMSLKHHPKSLRLLYSYADILEKQEPPSEKCIKAFDAFLDAAPEDNPNVPACYYVKADYYVSIGNQSKFLECYKAGLAAEKKQLPCFLPYNFKGKSAMEFLYAAYTKDSVINTRDKDHRFEQIKADPKRKLLLVQNRQSFIAQIQGDATTDLFSEMTLKPPSSSSTPLNWKSLKTITFKDMDPTKDKIYDGCILKVRIIDWPFLLTNIQTKIEDENGDVNRITICNWPKSGNRKYDILEAMKVFRPNVKISIINPYYRISSDGEKNTILVESPEFIKLDTSMINKLCHVCGEEAKELSLCPNCKMAIYCSNECDKLDWTEFNHKEICKHLKMFSSLM
uniref:MYND-type domain-containing protein n=1 Tax=Panagrolaimus davidi TaxID=227884 RepID=A0A914R8V8_9BILA